MRRFHSARRRPCGSWTRCGSRPRTGDGAKTKGSVILSLRPGECRAVKAPAGEDRRALLTGEGA
jgi:hypothetical protein